MTRYKRNKMKKAIEPFVATAALLSSTATGVWHMNVDSSADCICFHSGEWIDSTPTIQFSTGKIGMDESARKVPSACDHKIMSLSELFNPTQGLIDRVTARMLEIINE